MLTGPRTLPSPRTLLRKLGLLALALLMIGGGVLFWHFQHFRLGPIADGFFRSRQPSAGELTRTIERQGIRTVINLRGRNPKREWFREEEEATRGRGVTLVSLPFETFDWPPRIETGRFVAAVRRAERPVLIHCATGIDRSGWAAGVIRLLRGESLDAALVELSRARGHVCDPVNCPLHQFFEMYRRWLGAGGRRHDAATFAIWATEVYCPVPYDARIALLGDPPRSVKPGAELSMRTIVTNASPAAWRTPLEGDKGVRLGARVLGPLNGLPDAPVDLFRVPRAPAVDVFRDRSFVGLWEPGLTRQVEVTFRAPEKAGLYLIQVDMVDELVHWFSDLGREGIVIPLVVEIG